MCSCVRYNHSSGNSLFRGSGRILCSIIYQTLHHSRPNGACSRVCINHSSIPLCCLLCLNHRNASSLFKHFIHDLPIIHFFFYSSQHQTLMGSLGLTFSFHVPFLILSSLSNASLPSFHSIVPTFPALSVPLLYFSFFKLALPTIVLILSPRLFKFLHQLLYLSFSFHVFIKLNYSLSLPMIFFSHSSRSSLFTFSASNILFIYSVSSHIFISLNNTLPFLISFPPHAISPPCLRKRKKVRLHGTSLVHHPLGTSPLACLYCLGFLCPAALG